VRPFGVFGDQRITFWDHSGSSIYHGLQAQLVSRFARASQFQASYTWSRTIANDSLDSSDGNLSANVATLDVQNPGLDRGLARTHREHMFNAALVWNLPALQNESSFVKHAFGDWEIATIAIASTGSPVTVFTGSIPGLSGGPSGTGYTDNQRPNRVSSEPCRASGGSPEQWLNPAAFTLSNFALGSIGNSGRGVCDGPGVFQVDLSFYKNIHLTDHVKLQFRFDIFNVFNRVNFLNVNNTMNPTAVTFDTPDAANATKITSYTVSSAFGQATAVRDPRQAQFGFKILF
jgi:hypothetical protein